MLDTLRRFIADLSGENASAGSDLDAQQTEIAVAALLAFIVAADGEVDEREQAVLEDVLARNFDLDRTSARDLVAEGVAREEEAVDFYTFTSRLNRVLDDEGRRNVVRMMWEVVFADGRAQELEDNIVWRVADLLGVSDRQRIELKIATQAQLKPHD